MILRVRAHHAGMSATGLTVFMLFNTSTRTSMSVLSAELTMAYLCPNFAWTSRQWTDVSFTALR